MNETELLQKIKDAEQQLADARRMLEEYKNKMPYLPKDGEIYYYIDADTVVDVDWASDYIDRGRYSTGNVFRTRDDAEREVRRRKTHQKLKELAAKWNTEPIEASNYQTRYTLCYTTKGVLAMYSTDGFVQPNMVYFNKNVLDKLLDEISRAELIEYCKGDY